MAKGFAHLDRHDETRRITAGRRISNGEMERNWWLLACTADRTAVCLQITTSSTTMISLRTVRPSVAASILAA